ncbi:hypothetical protein VTK26DRAFT_1591 [Humicola hyalothermophila]
MGETNVRLRAETCDAERQDGNCSTNSNVTEPDVAVIDTDHPDAPVREARHVQDLEEDNSPPTPRFIQDEGAWKRFKWVPYPVRRIIKAAAKWARGPPSPIRYRIEPFFPRIQHTPIVLLDRYLPRKLHRALLVVVYLALWILTFALVKRDGQYVSQIEGWGTPTAIGCGASYWEAGNGCGLDGSNCRPFSGGGFAFRCPANCASYQLWNPYAVGDQELVYQQLVVGGPPAEGDGPAIYRGDSFICGAAIHAGVISDATGGCGVVRLVGRHQDYNSSERNGITSVGFDSYFPLSITFEPGITCDARDARWSLLAVSVVFTTVFSLFVTSPALFFFPLFTILFWTVGMATDAPNITHIPSLFSVEIGRFLPAMFVAWVMYDKMGIRRALKGLTAQVEKTVLWLGAAWVGSLTNYTLDFIPIQRLTGRDLERQPGARAALAIIVIILAVIVTIQVWFFRQEARLIRFLQLYLILGLGLLVLGVIPDLHLRIHHYILALLLLPGTSLQMRPSLLYQGLLIGLFINGIARWNFDPILQTDVALRGEGPLGTELPTILEPVVAFEQDVARSITFTWDPPPQGADYDGISVLVNDVERFRRYFFDEDARGKTENITWVREPGLQANEYFRFAWMQGSSRGDYTKAGKWDAQGEWTRMADGPSKLRARSDAGGEIRRTRARTL